ncbi:hypothetical protein ACF1BE_29095 [Streptomyces sp. NPDC014991]|uniref:hypothetical protein n=1 Tax=Streptomyces sp. NPDC014991 TaxID=3364935 RepID=UPI0036FBF256
MHAATVRLVAGGYVYGDGRLVVLDERTGSVLWRYRHYPEPPPMSPNPAEEDWRGSVVPGIATSRSRLFVPAADGTGRLRQGADRRTDPRPDTVPTRTVPGRARMTT